MHWPISTKMPRAGRLNKLATNINRGFQVPFALLLYRYYAFIITQIRYVHLYTDSI